MMEEQDRGTGRTTKQMQEAPQGALFIWCNHVMYYPRSLAKHLQRTDLVIIGPEDMYRCWRPWPDIVLDHATCLSEQQMHEYSALRALSGNLQGGVQISGDTQFHEPAAQSARQAVPAPTEQQAPSVVYAIRHVATQTFMPCRMVRSGNGGWSHWSPGAPAAADGRPMDGDPYDRRPRLFYSAQSARNAISMWAAGKWVRSSGKDADTPNGPGEYWDDLGTETPPVPRSADQLEIVPYILTETRMKP